MKIVPINTIDDIAHTITVSLPAKLAAGNILDVRHFPCTGVLIIFEIDED